MALTGLILFGFVIGHMAGNLTLYGGPQAMYDYAAGLRKIPGGLWVARAVLLVSVLAHAVTSFQLNSANEAARTNGYKVKKDIATSYAAHAMKLTGPILAFYIVFHIAHLTFGKAHPNYDQYNVYNNVVHGFQVWWVSLLYIAGNAALGLHLYHGAWSLFQTLGVNHPRYNDKLKMGAVALAMIVVIANIGFPIAVMLGICQPTDMTFPPF